MFVHRRIFFFVNMYLQEVFLHIRAYTTPFIGSPKQNFIIIPCAKVEAFPVTLRVCVCIINCVLYFVFTHLVYFVLANYYNNQTKKLQKHNPNYSFNVFVQFFTLSILTICILRKGEQNFFVSVAFYYIHTQHKENFP